MEIFRAYIESYLKNHPQIHTKKMDLIVRELAPTSTGLPVELIVLTKTINWNEHERIQAEIIDHLLAAARSSTCASSKIRPVLISPEPCAPDSFSPVANRSSQPQTAFTNSGKISPDFPWKK